MLYKRELLGRSRKYRLRSDDNNNKGGIFCLNEGRKKDRKKFVFAKGEIDSIWNEERNKERMKQIKKKRNKVTSDVYS